MAMPLSGLRQIVAMQRIELGVSHFIVKRRVPLETVFESLKMIIIVLLTRISVCHISYQELYTVYIV